MTQLSNVKVIGLMVDFFIFCGEWQIVATYHRTQYMPKFADE